MRIVATQKSHQNKAALDPWTVVHFGTGLALGLMNAPRAWSLGLATGYELVEQILERRHVGQELFKTSGPEVVPNALADLAVFAAGHELGQRWNRTGRQ